MNFLARLIVVFLSAVVIAAEGPPVAPQSPKVPQGIPIIWRDPGAIGSKDLYWGIGRSDRAPQPPFVFVEEDAGGRNAKVNIRDARGMIWNVKFSNSHENEVHAEIAASRLTWALGYLVEESYYVAEGRIEGVGKLRQAASSIAPDGTFRSARFEPRAPEVVRTGQHWSFEKNPFLGSKELAGLKILTTLLNNWDIKTSNTAILQVPTENGRVEEWHLFSDLGATFGRMDQRGLFAQRNKWNLADYEDQKFIDGVRNGRLNLHHRGDPPIDSVSLGHARWFAELATQLTADQIRQAFKAAGASAPEIEGFSARVMAKIDELRSAVKAPHQQN